MIHHRKMHMSFFYYPASIQLVYLTDKVFRELYNRSIYEPDTLRKAVRLKDDRIRKRHSTLYGRMAIGGQQRL